MLCVGVCVCVCVCACVCIYIYIYIYIYILDARWGAKAPQLARYSEPRSWPCPERWPWRCDSRWLKPHNSTDTLSLALAPSLELRSSIAKATCLDRCSEQGLQLCAWRWPWQDDPRLLKPSGSRDTRSYDPGLAPGAGPGNTIPDCNPPTDGSIIGATILALPSRWPGSCDPR